MPKIYKNISLADFNNKYNQISDLNDKFEFVSGYILSYGLDTYLEDCKLYELIHVAKNKFIESSIEAKKEYEKANNKKLDQDVINPKGYKNKNDEKLQQLFISNPIEYIKGYALSIKETSNNNNDIELDNLKKHVDLFVSRLDDEQEELEDYEAAEATANEVKANIGKLVFNNPNISVDEMLKNNKGGVFENLFATTSNEYNEFKEAFLIFNNPNHVGYGYMDNLEEKTKAYLVHKIPSFKKNGDLPKEEDIAKLSGTSRKRTEFCVGVLKAIYHQREIENVAEHFNDMELSNDDIEKEQELFQKDLSKNVDDKFMDNIFTNEADENKSLENEIDKSN